MILGEIRGRDVARYCFLIVHEFGWRVLGRCVVAVATGRRTTFLHCAFGVVR